MISNKSGETRAAAGLQFTAFAPQHSPYLPRAAQIVADVLDLAAKRLGIVKPTRKDDKNLLEAVTPKLGGGITALSALLRMSRDPTPGPGTGLSYLWLHLMCLCAQICRPGLGLDVFRAGELARALSLLAESMREQSQSEGLEAVQIVLRYLEPDTRDRQQICDWLESSIAEEEIPDLSGISPISRHIVFIYAQSRRIFSLPA